MTQTELVALVITVIKENARKSTTAQRAIWKAMILGDGYEDFLDCALDKVWGPDYKRAHNALYPPTTAELDAKAAKRRATRAEEKPTLDLIKGVIAGNILEHVELNGKPLGDCTGAELPRTNGFYKYLAAEVGPHERVRNKFSEEDLQSIARDTLFPDAASSPMGEDRLGL